METGDIITLIVLPGIATLFGFFASRIFPAFVAHKSDTRENAQEKERTSLGQVINTNDYLIKELVKIIDVLLSRVPNLESNIREMDERLKSLVDEAVNEMARRIEVEDDIDITLSEMRNQLDNIVTLATQLSESILDLSNRD